jgi:hypothetical protein
MGSDFDSALTASYPTDDGVNLYLNQNWKVASEAMKPIISKTIEDVLLEYMKKMFDELPGDFLVSDLPTPKELESMS